MSSGGSGRSRPLADGLVLRAAQPDDVDAIEASQLAVFGPAERQGVRTFLSGPGFAVDDWAVVCDPTRPAGTHVVASCALVPFPLVVSGIDVPAGEIEFVATDEGYRRRGLVRALIDWHHERSAARGDLLQLISGIPYVYRRFGYGWGISAPTELAVGTDVALRPDPDVVFRAGTKDDIDALVALDSQRQHLPVRGRRDALRFERWQWFTELADPTSPEGDRFLVAERHDEVVGWQLTGLRPTEHAFYLIAAAAVDDRVTDAMLDRARSAAAAASVRTALFGHPTTILGRRLHEVGTPDPSTYGIYVRVPDALALLRHLQPLLSARLAASSMATASGEVTLTRYTDAVRIRYTDGAVTAIEPTAAVEDPDEDESAIGVPPDWFPALVLGRFGARELELRVDDVLLGHHRELAEILFPRLDADVYGDF